MTHVDILYKQIGVRVRSTRESQEIKQDELASRIGLTRTSISNIENGRQKIQVHTLYAIANALGVDAKDLLPPVTVSDQMETISDDQALSELHPTELDWIKEVLFNEKGNNDGKQE